MGRHKRNENQQMAPQILCKPKNRKQARLLKAIQENDIVFAVGAAGAGKSHIAVSYGLQCLFEGKVSKLILVRPAIEAGENLGYLPGELLEKMEPYLQPAFSVISKHLGPAGAKQLMGEGRLEISPLAFMRGITFENAFVILDEAQNTSDEQMEMFLTRLGENCKMVVCGDHTQSDLRDKRIMGLARGIELLIDVPGIEVIMFEECDTVRHPLVRIILSKYKEVRHETPSIIRPIYQRNSITEKGQTAILSEPVIKTDASS